MKSYHARVLRNARHEAVLSREVFFSFLGSITQRERLASLAMRVQPRPGALQYVELPILSDDKVGMYRNDVGDAGVCVLRRRQVHRALILEGI